jgi:hypothetical protein
MEELETILRPPRIGSLESKSIRVIAHTGPEKTETHTINDIFMFQTVFALKQRIALKMASKSWAPEYVFVAIESDENKFIPIEFSWEFSSKLNDPYADVGKARPELYKDDSIMPISPSLHQGILLKNAIAETMIVHVWSADLLLKTLGQAALSESTFYGYFKYYFPTLNSIEDLARVAEAKAMLATEPDVSGFDAAPPPKKAAPARRPVVARR